MGLSDASLTIRLELRAGGAPKVKCPPGHIIAGETYYENDLSLGVLAGSCT